MEKAAGLQPQARTFAAHVADGSTGAKDRQARRITKDLTASEAMPDRLVTCLPASAISFRFPIFSLCRRFAMGGAPVPT